MTGVVVAAHGDLAKALVQTARMVLQIDYPVEVVAIESTDTGATYEARLQEAIERVAGKQAVLVLTDMFGGTPSNIGMTKHDPGRVEVLTGVNLPMLIKALQMASSEQPLEQIASRVKEVGVRSIAIATEMLFGGPSSTGGANEGEG